MVIAKHTLEFCPGENVKPDKEFILKTEESIKKSGVKLIDADAISKFERAGFDPADSALQKTVDLLKKENVIGFKELNLFEFLRIRTTSKFSSFQI